MNQYPLFDSFSLKVMDDESFMPLIARHRQQVFGDILDFRFREVLSETEQQSLDILAQRFSAPWRLNLGVFDGDEIIGWSWGQQDSPERFYMVNSAILPEYRGRGLYSAMLDKALELVKSEGFQVVYSRHVATNNAIIVPKLKAGFVITSMELSDIFGTLVHLSYYFNESRRQVMDFRAGERGLDSELKKHIKNL